MNHRKPKVLLAMSGGVDSSVAAALLLRDGYSVVGCFMRLGSPGDTIDELTPDSTCDTAKIKLGHQGCCSVSDADDARLVAAQLGIPFYVVNFKKDFGRIMDYFAAEYAAGRTPNPCVRCNDWLKFGKLHDYAEQIDADFVASGHYARVVPSDASLGTSVRLLRGIDADKDQSYVLFGVPRDRLARMLLPVGGLRKTEVRRIAEELKLPVFNKPDSQEICFVPDNDYASFVDRRHPVLGTPAVPAGSSGNTIPRGVSPGPILDPTGKQVGTHNGQHRFTIGQRRGVGVALGYPIFVVHKDPAAGTITVGPREMLRSSSCTIGEANWLVDESTLADWTPAWIKYRYNSDAVRGTVRVLPSPEGRGRGWGSNGDNSGSDRTPATAHGTSTYSGRTGRFEVRFDEPQEAVTPGQALVVYSADDPDHVLGGGWIERVDKEK